MSKREWSASDQIQRHGDEASKKMSGHLIADMGHHREVICTVRFSKCEPVGEDDDDQKLPARREVPCASPPVDDDDDVTKKKGKKKAKMKSKKKAITLSLVLGAKITETVVSTGSIKYPRRLEYTWKVSSSMRSNLDGLAQLRASLSW